MTTTSFTRQDGLFIDANLHQFIEEQLCSKTTLNTTEVYQTLATLIDEFGCQCRKTKHQENDILEVDTLLNAYQQKNHPQCHVDAQTTESVLCLRLILTMMSLFLNQRMGLLSALLGLIKQIQVVVF